MAMRYQHATKERDKALSDKLGSLFSAAPTSSAPVTNTQSIG